MSIFDFYIIKTDFMKRNKLQYTYVKLYTYIFYKKKTYE